MEPQLSANLCRIAIVPDQRFTNCLLPISVPKVEVISVGSMAVVA